jgi:ribonuclease HII
MHRNLVAPPPSLDLERGLALEGTRRIAGTDEVGVGAIAGPVVAAAVVLPLPVPGERFEEELARLASTLAGVRDSKQIRGREQERLFDLIHAVASLDVGIGVVRVHELFALANQTRAAQLATARALRALPSPPDHVLLDGGMTLADATVPSTAVSRVHHNTTSLSIAAASVVATIAIHRIMRAYGDRYPMYGFQRHHGYPSPAHLAALAAHGPSPVHHPHNATVRRLSLAYRRRMDEVERDLPAPFDIGYGPDVDELVGFPNTAEPLGANESLY